MTETHDKLEREIFGSNSDLSEEDEDIPRHRSPPGRRQRPDAGLEDDFPSSSGASSEDDYVQEPAAGKRKKLTKKRPSVKGKEADGEDEDEAMGGEGGRERKRKGAQKKRKRAQPEIDLSQLPPEQAKKMRLDMQIDAIIKPKKGTRKKRKNEDVLEHFADDEVARLREAMINAAAEDDAAIKEGLPGMAKLKLLPEVMEVLRKAALAQSIIDNNLLQGVRRWLEPLPDKSLPALNIQREFFPILKKMEYIDSSVLKESGLGKVILFYTKCRRVNADVSRTANDLVSLWSRPIIKRSASYRDRIVPIAQMDEGGRPGGERLNAILARAKENEKGRVRTNAVAIPRSDLGSYTVAPKTAMRTNVGVEGDIERRRKTAERFRTLTRKVTMKS